MVEDADLRLNRSRVNAILDILSRIISTSTFPDNVTLTSDKDSAQRPRARVPYRILTLEARKGRHKEKDRQLI